MVKYSSPSGAMPFTLERMTTAAIDPPITQYELAAGLLSPSELATAIKSRNRVFIKGRLFPFTYSKPLIEDLLSIVRPECLTNGDVEFKTESDFCWAVGHSMILRKYGLSHLGLRGTKERISGIVIGSIVSYDNQDIHIKRYANVLRAIKSYVPHSKISYETCFTNQLKCDRELEEKLRDWMEEKNPQQPKREKND